MEFSEKTNRPMKAIPEGWNKWDVIEIKGPKTCIELIDDFNKKYDVDIDMITGNGVTLVNFVFLNEELRKKLSIKIEDKYKEKTGKEIISFHSYFSFSILNLKFIFFPIFLGQVNNASFFHSHSSQNWSIFTRRAFA